MIDNATLISIATPASSAAGRVTYATATELGVRCNLDDVIEQQRRQLGAVIGDATSVMRLLKSATDTVPVKGQKVVTQIDGGDEKDNRIVFVRDRQKSGGLEHWECFLVEI